MFLLPRIGTSPNIFENIDIFVHVTYYPETCDVKHCEKTQCSILKTKQSTELKAGQQIYVLKITFTWWRWKLKIYNLLFSDVTWKPRIDNILYHTQLMYCQGFESVFVIFVNILRFRESNSPLSGEYAPYSCKRTSVKRSLFLLSIFCSMVGNYSWTHYINKSYLRIFFFTRRLKKVSKFSTIWEALYTYCDTREKS